MDLTTLLDADRIVVGADARSKKRALELVADALARGDDDLGHGAVFSAIVARERLGSTALGNGAALPHGRIAGLSAPRGALLRLAAPVDFEAPDGVPVDLVFGLLVPEECAAEHLAALAAVAERLQHAAVRDAVRAAPDARAALRRLTEPTPRRHAAG